MPTGTVSRLVVRSHDAPDETRSPRLASITINNFEGHTVGRFAFDPGWTWADSVKPVAGTDSCQKTHVGYCVSGELEVELVDGMSATIRPGDSYTIPPGHNARVLGDHQFVGIEFESADTYAKS